MIRDEDIIEEINELWLPVYPHMADHLLALSRVSGGRFLDLGPFAGGLALNVLWRTDDFRVTVIDQSERLLRWVQDRALEGDYFLRLITRRSALEPIPEPDGEFDLIAVRGAFFFLTPFLLKEIRRVLRPGGFAWVGGGYGPSTPAAVISAIAERSKTLNEAVGKRRITAAEATALVTQAGLSACARISSSGGLWIEIQN